MMTEKTSKVKRLLERDGALKCHYCGVDLVWDNSVYRPDGLSIDHIEPVSKGGKDRLDNLVLACRDCNGRKHTKHYQEFRFAMESDAVILFLMGDEDDWI